MSRWDSDLDYHDWATGPYGRPNATCPQCHRDFIKGRDDVGSLCDDCCRLRDVGRVRATEQMVLVKK